LAAVKKSCVGWTPSVMGRMELAVTAIVAKPKKKAGTPGKREQRE
jgi:hypothetical protein